MSNLSSETLFHFTSKLDNLNNILLKGLRYGMFGEKIPGTSQAYFVRGISFCNIPLSMISEHVDWYGKYAIGLKRSDLREKGATPVMYVHSQTPFLRVADPVDKLKDNPCFCYMKQFLGYQMVTKDGKRVPRRKKFYDEKEWRLIKGEHIVDSYGTVDDLDKKRKGRDETIAEVDPLEVPPDMIEYIILGSPDDLVKFTEFIDQHDELKSAREEYLTKILYYSQIKKDF